MTNLSEYEQDALSESFNIGIGVAAAALSEMTAQEVSLSVPTIRVLNKQDASEELAAEGGDQRISGVREQFKGPFRGSAMLLFPEEHSLELVRLLLQEDIDLAYLTEMEQEALVEVGNIILNACLGSIADIIGDEIINETPLPLKGLMSDILQDDSNISEDDHIMRLKMEFQVKEVDIKGYIAFVMDIHSLDTFRRKVADYFGFSTV